MRCSGCGGVLGRDCYNERECIEISRRNYDDYLELQHLWNQLAELQDKVNILEETLEINNIPLPYIKPIPVSFEEHEEDDDWLPF